MSTEISDAKTEVKAHAVLQGLRRSSSRRRRSARSAPATARWTPTGRTTLSEILAGKISVQGGLNERRRRLQRSAPGPDSVATGSEHHDHDASGARGFPPGAALRVQPPAARRARSRRTCCCCRRRPCTRSSSSTRSTASSTSASTTGTSSPGAANPGVGFANYTAVFHDPEVETAALNTLLFTVITVPIQMALGLVRRRAADRPPARPRAAARTDLHPGRHLVGGRQLHLRLHLRGAGRPRERRDLASSPATPCTPTGSPRSGPATPSSGWSASGRASAGPSSCSWPRSTACRGRWSRPAASTARPSGASGATSILPSIRPTIVFVLVLLVIGASQVFTQVFLLTQGGPYGSTQVLLSYAYQQAFTDFQFSYAAAIASLMAVVVLALSILQIRVMRRGEVAVSTLQAEPGLVSEARRRPLATPPAAQPRAGAVRRPHLDTYAVRRRLPVRGGRDLPAALHDLAVVPADQRHPRSRTRP